MLGKLIAITHLLIAFFLSFYAFIIPKNLIYDYLYICALVLMQLIWIIFKGECPFSYFYKKYYYPNYKLGDTTTTDDFKELDFTKNNTDPIISGTQLVNISFCIAIILSIIFVAFRSRIANPYLIIFICVFMRFFYLFFNDATGYDTNYVGKLVLGKNYSILENIYYKLGFDKLHTEINVGISLILISFLGSITYNNLFILKSVLK